MVDREETEPFPTEFRTHRLYAEFEIEPDTSVSCPLDAFDGEIKNIRQQVSRDECHTDTDQRERRTSGTSGSQPKR